MNKLANLMNYKKSEFTIILLTITGDLLELPNSFPCHYYFAYHKHIFSLFPCDFTCELFSSLFACMSSQKVHNRHHKGSNIFILQACTYKYIGIDVVS